MKRIRRPVRTQDTPEATGDLMANMLARIGGSGRGLEYRVFEAYAQVAGDVLRKRTVPDSLRERTLFIRVKSSALAHELTLLRGELLERMAVILGPNVVTEIRTRVSGAAQ